MIAKANLVTDEEEATGRPGIMIHFLGTFTIVIPAKNSDGHRRMVNLVTTDTMGGGGRTSAAYLEDFAFFFSFAAIASFALFALSASSKTFFAHWKNGKAISRSTTLVGISSMSFAATR